MARTRRWLWLMLFALVAAQTLGLVHRVSHAGKASTLSNPSAGWVAAFQDSHTDDPSCQVFDQASQALLSFDAPVTALALFALNHFIQWSLGEAVARWAALFEARGPPAFR
ncbi:MAG: hypothetical protein V4669_21035 [Pseudomonadota bacterium]